MDSTKRPCHMHSSGVASHVSSCSSLLTLASTVQGKMYVKPNLFLLQQRPVQVLADSMLNEHGVRSNSFAVRSSWQQCRLPLACWFIWAWFIANWEMLRYEACQQFPGGGDKAAGLARLQLHSIGCSLSSGLQANDNSLPCCESCLSLSCNNWHLHYQGLNC